MAENVLTTVPSRSRRSTVVDLAMATSWYGFLNRRRGARRALNQILPPGARYVVYGGVMLAVVPAAILWLVASWPLSGIGGWLRSPLTLSLGVWLLFVAQGTGVEQSLRVVHGHVQPILRQSTVDDRTIFFARVIAPRMLTTFAAGVLTFVVVSQHLSVLLAAFTAVLLVLIRLLLTSFDPVDPHDHRQAFGSLGLTFAHVVLSQIVAIGGLGLCILLGRRGGPIPLVERLGFVGVLGAVAAVAALLVSHRLVRASRTASVGRPTRRVRRDQRVLALLEMSAVVRSPRQAIDFIDSLPGLSIYLIYGLYFASVSLENGASFLIYVTSLLAHVTVVGQLLEDHFNPIHNRVLRSRQYSDSLQGAIAGLRFRVLVTLLFALTAPIILINVAIRGGFSSPDGVGILALALGCLAEAGVLIYGTLSVTDATAEYREESFADSSIIVYQSVAAGGVLAMCIVIERLVALTPPGGALALNIAIAVGGIALVARAPAVISRLALPVVWRAS